MRIKHEHFSHIVPGYLSFSNWVKFVKSCRPIFSCTITNEWVLLPIFASSPSNVTPIASPVLENLWSPSNTKTIRHLSRPCLKTSSNKNIIIISWMSRSPECTCDNVENYHCKIKCISINREPWKYQNLDVVL